MLVKALFLSAIALICMTALQACQVKEQNRQIIHNKGVYEGPTDQVLSKEQQDRLRARALYQRTL